MNAENRRSPSDRTGFFFSTIAIHKVLTPNLIVNVLAIVFYT